MRVSIGYPAATDEEHILEMHVQGEPIASVGPVLTIDDLLGLQQAVRAVKISKELQSYIVAISRASREHPGIRLGLSPRGSLALMKAAQAHAFVHGSRYVTPDSIKAVAVPVIGHRLILDPEREAIESNRSVIVEEIMRAVPVPILPHVAVDSH
jgi:MoxR-like ATPase